VELEGNKIIRTSPIEVTMFGKQRILTCFLIFLFLGTIFGYVFRYQILGFFSEEPKYRGIPFSCWKKWVNEWVQYENATNWTGLVHLQHHDLYEKPSNEVIKMIEDGKWEVKDPLGNDREACPLLIDLLQEKNRQVRIYSIRKLGLLGPEAKDAIPDLTKSLEDVDDVVKQYAAVSLGRIGKNAKEAVPALLEILKDQRKTYRFWIVKGVVVQAIQEIDPIMAAKNDSLLKQKLTIEEKRELFERHVGLRRGNERPGFPH